MKYIVIVLFSFVSITSALCADVSSCGWYVQPSALYVLPKGDYKAGLGGLAPIKRTRVERG